MPEYPGFREKKTYYVDEIDTLKRLLREAQSDNEALRARVAELESGLSAITSYPDVREYVGTICHDAALSALGGTGNPWLLRQRADAAEDAYKSTVLSTKGDHPEYEKGFDDAMNQYDSQMGRYVSGLRQQADELEADGHS